MDDEVKEPLPKYNFVSREDYLAFERASEEKHEYFNGSVEVMSGASMRHNYIASNLYTHVGSFLLGKECSILPSEMRVYISSTNSYVYPDATILCGEPALQDENFDTLLNPMVIFEILSRSTKAYDRRIKFMYYQRIPTLTEYIIIDSMTMSVSIARRQEDDAWKFEFVERLEDALNIQSIGCSIPLHVLYHRTGL